MLAQKGAAIAPGRKPGEQERPFLAQVFQDSRQGVSSPGCGHVQMGSPGSWVSTSYPSAVTRMVCSHCAEAL